MSEIAIGQPRGSGVFNRGTILLVVAIGVVAFVAMLVLGAYAPDLRSGKNAGSHALSNAATGFSGLVRLAEATGREPHVIRSDQDLNSEALAVFTPESAAVDLSEVLVQRGGKATLIVLPKWDTVRDEQKTGWVRVAGLLPVNQPQGILAPQFQLNVRRSRGDPRRALSTAPTHAPAALAFVEPNIVQSISGAQLRPIVTDQSGRILVAQIEQRPLYVVADPDLLNNHGMANKRQAASALALLDFLNSTDADATLFDVTLNGLGQSRSPLKLMFDPPFLAVTIAIFIALLLAGLQGLYRFGAPLRPVRAIAFGKRALVDNSASLIRRAGREARLGERYAAMVRDRAQTLFRNPGPASDRLDLVRTSRPFSELEAAATDARSRETLLDSAQQLYQWLKEAKA